MVFEAAVGSVVVDVIYFQGVVDRDCEDAVGGDPDCPVFEDMDVHTFYPHAGLKISVPVQAEGDETSGAAAGDLAAGEVVDPVAGDVFVPCGVVACVEYGGGGRFPFFVGWCWGQFRSKTADCRRCKSFGFASRRLSSGYRFGRAAYRKASLCSAKQARSYRWCTFLYLH